MLEPVPAVAGSSSACATRENTSFTITGHNASHRCRAASCIRFFLKSTREHYRCRSCSAEWKYARPPGKAPANPLRRRGDPGEARMRSALVVSEPPTLAGSSKDVVHSGRSANPSSRTDGANHPLAEGMAMRGGPSFSVELLPTVTHVLVACVAGEARSFRCARVSRARGVICECYPI